MIEANYYANWSTAILTMANIIWVVEIILNGVIQRKDLNNYVKVNWKLPVALALLLGISALAVIYLPLAMTGYVICFFALIVQALIMFDYHRVLGKYIQESWYLTSTMISLIIAVLASISVLVFAITAIAVTDY